MTRADALPLRLAARRQQFAFLIRNSDPMILNRQKQYLLNVAALRVYVQRLKQGLRLGGRDFNVCLVGDQEMARLNATYRQRPYPTDVLSFPWQPAGRNGSKRVAREFKDFLGDVVISVQTARANARQEGHPTLNEIRWLILHGVLHLLGYDHETDRGEMTRLELALRERLARAGKLRLRRPRRQASVRHG